MANRLTFTDHGEIDHGEIGLICNLTNTYCLVGSGGSKNFYSSIEAEFEDVIPIIKTSIGGSSSVGRYCIVDGGVYLAGSLVGGVLTEDRVVLSVTDGRACDFRVAPTTVLWWLWK
ncbi:eukaryotic translation initiation factor 6-2-like protein [Trifolium pratense]|uniref:Eukaryotic translation initiation factor 6-2-like protein n=1 Tax=Trifolium pratense TaxID=57577 RepID=A0A2K3LLH6_TRIPR|nr:eukaryotic translation initiation factor 6-2-like protein [Trifolium pratense]